MLLFSSVARRAALAVLLLATAAAFCLRAQQSQNPAPPGARIGLMTRHGFAGVVTSVDASQIVMEISEDVSMTVNVTPSTRIVDFGQQATLQDIHVGDAIFASGQVDEQAHTIDAATVELRPAQLARMLEMRRANFGRTWTSGVLTAIGSGSLTVKRMDGQSQTFSVDPDTVYQLRDRPGDSTMLRLGERIDVRLRSSGGQLFAGKVTIAGMTR